MSGYVGDFLTGVIVRDHFNSHGSNWEPASLVSGEIRIFRDDETTEISDGISLMPDFAGLTGYHVYEVDLSVGGHYLPGSDYRVFLRAGTVDGRDVSGSAVGSFSIMNRYAPDIPDIPDLSGLAGLTGLVGLPAAVDGLYGVLAGMTGISSAEIETAVGAALATYDAVTNTDLTSSLAGVSVSIYRIVCDAVYSGGDLKVTASLELNGDTVVAASNARADLYAGTTLVASLLTVATPDARGEFHFADHTVSISASSLYYLRVTIADAGATDRSSNVKLKRILTA